MTHYLNTLFVDSDDKLKAFLFPLIDNLGRMWSDEAVKLCTSFNGTLLEINSPEKELIFVYFLGQLDSQVNQISDIWFNDRKDSSDKK
jgi:hypothetical protein